MLSLLTTALESRLNNRGKDDPGHFRETNATDCSLIVTRRASGTDKPFLRRPVPA